MLIPRRFQVELIPDLEWTELRRRAVHSEELGLDLVSVSDQFVDWKNPSTPWFDVWVLLSAFAEATERIRLTPCVAQIPMRDPASFARNILSIDHISNGRVEAGIGLGLIEDPGYAMMGIENWSNPERVARFDEYVSVITQLFTTAQCSHDGDYYSVDAAVVLPSVQPDGLPLTIAAMGPKMMRAAATHADTWNAMSFGSGAKVLFADAQALKNKMTVACDVVDRDPESLRHSFLLFDSEAREAGRQYFYWESAAAFEDIAGQILDLGYDEIVMYYPVDEQRDVFEEVAHTVLPRLRQG
jgi:alkanesulfonate monooxygenase SsuD/methylene tetrahydromethanopterin reductase-like flavin-dependent oxidoreductase (luciferase family)